MDDRYRSPEDDKAQRREINRIGKKLNACQNPEKADIVAVTRAKAADKREGSESEADKKTQETQAREGEGGERRRCVWAGSEERRVRRPLT